MLAKLANDKGISTLGHTAFHFGTGYDFGTKISTEMAHEVLDYQIVKEQSCRPNGEAIPRQYHLIRTDTNSLVDTAVSVGDEFDTAAQPIQVLEFAEGLCTLVKGLELETVATLNGGATQICCLALGGLMPVRGDKSPRFDHIILHNPLTRGKLAILAHNVRVVCENTLQAALHTGIGYRISHTKNSAQVVQRALDTLNDEIHKLADMRQKVDFLASKSINSAQVDALMDTLYPLPIVAEGGKTNGLTRMKSLRDEVLNQFESDDTFTDKTYWAFLNAATYQEEHPLHKQARVDDAQVAYENLVGNRSAKKVEIFNKVWSAANSGEVIEAEYRIVA